MLKLTLTENQKEEFLNYSYARINKEGYNHITKSILINTFDFFLKHKLTVEANAKSYWYKNNKKQIECYGYSGFSINERDNIEGIIENLFHEIFCKAEWIARGIKDGYSDICKNYFGKDYNKIIQQEPQIKYDHPEMIKWINLNK